MNTVLSLLAVTISASLQAKLPNDLISLESMFLQNEYAAKTKLKGKTLTIPTYVTEVKEVKGKVILNCCSVFDNRAIYVTATLAAAAKSVALKLRPGDEIKFTGKFESRAVYSKDRLVIDGYIPSSSSYSSGSIQGGTVTETWPVFTFSGTTVTIVQTAAAREKAAKAKEAAITALRNRFLEAMKTSDFAAMQKAINDGLDADFLNGLVRDIYRYEPDRSNYGTVIELFKFLLKSGKVDVGNALAMSIGFGQILDGNARRPQMFKVLSDLKLLNHTGLFDSGDNILLFLIKDPTNPRNLKFTFNEVDFEMVRVIAESGQAKGAADVKDRYGKSAKDYFRDAKDFLAPGLLPPPPTRAGGSDESVKQEERPKSAFEKIKELIMKME